MLTRYLFMFIATFASASPIVNAQEQSKSQDVAATYEKLGRKLFEALQSGTAQDYRKAFNATDVQIEKIKELGGLRYDEKKARLAEDGKELQYTRESAIDGFAKRTSEMVDRSLLGFDREVATLRTNFPGFTKAEFISANPIGPPNLNDLASEPVLKAGFKPYRFMVVHFKNPITPNLVYRMTFGDNVVLPDGTVTMIRGWGGILASQGDGKWYPIKSDGTPNTDSDPVPDPYEKKGEPSDAPESR